jgi:competence protein ComEC
LVSNFKFQIKNWLLLFLFLTTSAIWLAIFRFPEQKIKLVFCDVGEGDAALIIQGSIQILIDTGPNDKVLSCLSRYLPFWDKHLELVLITHYQKDHTGGLPLVKKYYAIGKLLDNTNLATNSQLAIGNWRLRVLNPDARVLGAATYQADDNANSLVFQFQSGRFKALFAGDIDTVVEKKIAWEDIDLLKVAHHGSKYATSGEFLVQTRPETAIISVGKNSYGHPTPEVLGRLGRLGIKIRRTDQEGDIVIGP